MMVHGSWRVVVSRLGQALAEEGQQQ